MKLIFLCILVFFSLPLFSQEAVPNTTSGKGALPIPSTTPDVQVDPPTAKTYAVVVGISDYQDEGIPDLRFADKDAEAFASFLQSPAGGSLDEDHLKVLINEQATQAQFAGALDWLWEVAGENDKAIIYFSGHGDVEKKSLTQPGFLLCWDAPSRVYMAGGAFPLPMLQEVISTISVQNKSKVIVVADACRSGKLSGSSVSGAQITGSNLARQYANEIKILSCQPNEYSIEGEQWGGGRGVFSYHLLDGLYGMADGNQDQSVNLLEISRYLEDKVPTEVSPQSQIPVTVGDRGEKLTDVFPEILAQLKEGRKGQLQLFTSTESRGIEDDVLAAADSNNVKMYTAFQKAVENKQFLEPANACADFYYEKLSNEPQLERLHSSMRRNYAAALQDDAQQALNTMLKTGLTKCVLCDTYGSEEYRSYPDYLARAAELLGEDHYMYRALQARRHFFIGEITEEKRARRQAFFRALEWQPNMPHAYMQLILSSEKEQPDSAAYYAAKAIEQVPSWVVPYTNLAIFHWKLKNMDKAEELLNEAGEVDSTSILVRYTKARFYEANRDLLNAEKWYLKTIENTSHEICFPCAYNQLGNIYIDFHKFDLAEKYLREAIAIDSNFTGAYVNLATSYGMRQMFGEAEAALKKSIELGETRIGVYINLAALTANSGRPAEAIPYFLEVLKKDSTISMVYTNLGVCHQQLGNYDEAESYLKKAILMDPNDAYAHNTLGIIFAANARYREAEELYLKSLQLDSLTWFFYANLGFLYQSQQRWEASETLLQKALQLSPPIVPLVAMLGNAHTHLPSRLEGAKTELDQALDMDADWPDTYIYLAQWHLKNNQMEETWQYLEKGLEKGFGNGNLKWKDLQEGPDFEEMRKEPKWGELKQKHFPDQDKD